MTVVITGQRPGCREAGPIVLAAMMAPGDDGAVAGMLRRCSAATLRHRFHGFTDGMAYLTSQLKASEVVVIATHGALCVGLGVLAADGSGPWEVGVVVEDAWQRHHVGTRLLAALVAEAKRRQVTEIRADVLGEDAFIVGLLRRIGPVTVYVDRETISVDVQLDGVQPGSPGR
jgi:GNAT superfamily N-acetyltransferase